jgi:preprotein translocase subunit YajC
MRLFVMALLLPAARALADTSASAQTAPVQGTPGTATSPAACLGGGGLEGFIPILAMIAIFYFLILRPQQKQQKDLRALRESLKKDDKIVTSGGIHGTVFSVKGDVISLKIADGVRIDIDKSAISAIDRRQDSETS